MKKLYLRIVLMIVMFFIFAFPGRTMAMTIVLDPGHGGKDSGAIYKNIYERDITLKTTKYLRDYLNEYDVKVILTHEGLASDVDFTIYDRAMVARNNNADLLVCLHYNSGNANGAEMWVTANKTLPKYNKEMTGLGNKILANLGQLGIANRGVKTKLIPTDYTDIYTDGSRADYYGIIRYAMRGTMIDSGVRKPAGAVDANIQNGEGIPAILVEHCYLQADYGFIDSDEDLKRIAEADGMAIVEYYGLKKKSEKIEIVSDDEIKVLKGDKKQIVTSIMFSENNPKLTYTSENSSIATVTNDGIITATGEGTTNITIKLDGTDITKNVKITVNALNDDEYIKINNLKEENGYLYRINPKTTASELAKNFEVSEGLEVKILADNLVGSDTRVSVSRKETGDVIKEYTAIIFGDVNGDGQIKASDYVLIKNQIMDDGKLKPSELLAADVKNDKAIKASDYVFIKNYIMNDDKIRIE